MSFKDHFSGHAAAYRQYRPGYPDALYAWLAQTAPARVCAWDCATGNGQAALSLSRYFDVVVATDASEGQLAHAVPAPNIEYRRAPAEHSALDDASIDLVTVAQALHWFDVEAFYDEVRRVLRPGGVLAIWSYNLLSIAPDIDAIIHTLYADILGDYWPAERRLIESGYADLPFPFERVAAPAFVMQAHWPLDALTGYLQTWSAVQKFIDARQANPLMDIIVPLRSAWGDSARARTVNWPLKLLIGRL